MRGHCLTVIAFGLLLVAAGQVFAADAPTRIAVLTGDGDRAVSDAALAQLEVALTDLKDITLLERAEIKKILTEQKLSAAGLSDPATAVKLGKLLSVEMFLYLDRIPKSNPAACRVQAVEAQTGIALAAEMVPESALGQKASTVPDLLATALAKKRVAPAARHYVGLLDLRNEEPGRSLDGLAEAAGMFLMADLGRSPEVIVLDRERVEQLTAEKVIAGLDVQIKTSSVLITGGLRRAAEKDKLNFTLELRPLGATSGRKITATAPQNDVPELRRVLAAAVLEGLGTKLPDFGMSAPTTEARTFAAQARMLASRGDYSAAVRAGEAAYALWPDDDTCRAASDAWAARKYGYGRIRNFLKFDLEDQRGVLNAAIRLRALALDYCRMRLKAAERSHSIETGFEPTWDEGESLTLMAMPAELKPLQEELRAAEREMRDLKVAYCNAHYDNSAVQEAYWHIWNHEVSRINIQDASMDALVIGSIREIANVYADPPGPTLSQWQSARMSSLGSIPGRMQVFNTAHVRSKDDAGRARYAALWREFQQHPDPFVRIVACEAVLFMGDKDPDTARLLLRTFLTDLPPGHPCRTDNSDYLLLGHMVDQAVSALVKKEPEAALDYCRQIAGPWILARNGVRLIAWQETTHQWLRLLEKKGCYAEADQVAGQIQDILSSARFSEGSGRQEDADKIAASMRDLRQEYAFKMGAAPTEDLWAQYDVKAVGAGLKADHQKSLVDGDRLFCVGAKSDGKAYTFTFGAWKLPGGQPLHAPESLVVPYKDWQQYPVTSMTCSGTKVYAGTPLGLLEYTPGGKVRLIPESAGVLGTEISALAWQDGLLYMGLGTSLRSKFGFATYDPATGKGVLIASSVAAEKKSPFDGVACQFRAVLSDPKRKCLWLSVLSFSEQSGLWRYWPESGKFDLAVKCSCPPEQDITWCGEKIIMCQPATGVVLMNPDTLAQTWLMSGHDARGTYPPAGVTGLPVIADIRVHLWPAWYDGECLLGYDGTCWARAPGKTAAHSKTIFSVVGFHPTPDGLLVTTQRGQAYWIKKKE